MRDASKPDGEACNADNTLKDASEIEWFHSPSQITATWSTQKQVRGDNEESTNEDDANDLPKPKRKVNAEYLIDAVILDSFSWWSPANVASHL